jgi:preprotein translocase subunit SecD
MKLFRNYRIIILILCLIFSLVAIKPMPWIDGISIRHVDMDSPAFYAGISVPAEVAPTSRERILELNGFPVKTLEEFYIIESEIQNGTTILLKTNKNTFVIDNATSNLGISVVKAATNNIRKGIDLQGGTRIVLHPVEEISEEDAVLIVSSINERLNIHGLSDVSVRSSTDLDNQIFFLVEMASLNSEGTIELITSQGKFEAKISNKTIFSGADIINVCRTPECSRIDCSSSGGIHNCNFQFEISLTLEAAERQAEATANLDVGYESGGSYLSEDLELFMDDNLFSSLKIGSSLKGQAATKVSISGPGSGNSREAAKDNALGEMKQLQTILESGSLPTNLEVDYEQHISPVLGEEFAKNSLIVAFFAFLTVSLVVFIRYRSFKVSIPMFFLMIFELIILLGVAASIGWEIDLAAIAGIIIAIGTALDHAIIISDETLEKKKEITSWKQRLKNAFFIIFGSYFTVVVAMIPLWAAGAGLLRGFAVITLLGFTIGVLITRPAFAVVLERFSER